MTAKKAKKPPKAPRTRRTQADAREQILDAAERRLLEAGPGGIRLQDVAADVGVSHPAILHHFGNRAGLVRAVVQRAIHALEADLIGALSSLEIMPDGRPSTQAMFRSVFEMLAGRGHARLIAWLVLSGETPYAGETAHEGWTKIAEITHAMRIASTKASPKPSFEDTRFTILLSAFVLFAEAISGRATFDAAGFAGDAKVADRFRNWFAGLVEAHMEGSGSKTRG